MTNNNLDDCTGCMPKGQFKAKEKSLSNKRIIACLNDSSEAKYRESDVKNFIKKLKEEIKEYDNSDFILAPIILIIDKLAGEKLI